MESLKTKLIRWAYNFFPPIRGSGAWITYYAHDRREIHLKLPLSWRTRNYVGTIYGGSMYSAIDPFYMFLLIQNLPKGTIVWDKAATIRFKRPGRETLYAKFKLDEQEIKAIEAELLEKNAIDRLYMVELVDAHGTVHATIEKTLYIKRAPREVL